MGSITFRTGCLVLGMQCAAAFAQDVDGATRAQRDAANPLRMIIEAASSAAQGGEGEPATAVDAKAPAAKAGAGEGGPAACRHADRCRDPDPPPSAPRRRDRARVAGRAAARPYDPDDYFGGAADQEAAVPRCLPVVPPGRRQPARPWRRPAPRCNSPSTSSRVARPGAPAPAGPTPRSSSKFTVNPDGSVADLAVRSGDRQGVEQSRSMRSASGVTNRLRLRARCLVFKQRK